MRQTWSCLLRSILQSACLCLCRLQVFQHPNESCIFTCTRLHVHGLCDTPLLGSSPAGGRTDSDRRRPPTGSLARTDTEPPSCGRSPRSEKTRHRPETCRRRPDRLEEEERNKTWRTLVFMKCLSAAPSSLQEVLRSV